MLSSVVVVVVVVFLLNEFSQVNALTTDCIDKNSQGGACCSGDIKVSSSATSISSSAFSQCTITSVDFTAAT